MAYAFNLPCNQRNREIKVKIFFLVDDYYSIIYICMRYLNKILLMWEKAYLKTKSFLTTYFNVVDFCN